MLEVKNLTKIYKTKGAESFVALNDVSVSFNSTGMVFLLGKSGSGKSTLLNVLGGLDNFDKGEIVVKGKSSKEFSRKDFDSYRNTYLGFVFQEYNILPEFTVYKNIALALELQGKKPDKENVMSLLQSVDLQGLAKRKPNQLSGGQKQRIAIARALIKNPEIILADEPTGALDSNTGKQVLDTLKKLSKDKLVIVVSHDREFAEQYADRIIELKDGKIISDVTKRKMPPQVVSSGFNLIGKNILHLKKGHKITPNETALINELLETTDDGIFLSADEKVNENIKKSARIDERGNNEYFDATTSADREKPVQAEKINLIKSHLKFKDSFKMGASGLKTKKVRLVFTIILSAIALALFGVSDTMASFNVQKCSFESLMKMQSGYVSVESQYKRYYSESDAYRSGIDVSKADKLELEDTYKNKSFVPVFNSNLSFERLTEKSVTNREYYRTYAEGLVSLNEASLKKFNLKMLSGVLPKAENEIALTEYQLELFNKYGLKNFVGEVNKNTILGKELDDGGTLYKVVGVVDTGFNSSQFQILKADSSGFSKEVYAASSKLQELLSNSFTNLIFISSKQQQKLETKVNFNYDTYGDAGFKIGDEYEGNTQYFSCDGESLYASTVFFDPSKTSLAENEVIVGAQTYFDGAMLFDNYNIYNSWVWDEETQEEVNRLVYQFDYQTYNSKSEFSAAVSNKFFNNYNKWSTGVTVRVKYAHQTKEVDNFVVVGVCFGRMNEKNNFSDAASLVFKNSESAPKELSHLFGVYQRLIVDIDETDRDMILAMSDYTNNDVKFLIRSEVSGTLDNFSSMILLMAKIFLYVSIGFAVFAALMLMNFISVSISHKKKEIGILRALGARGKDVYGIFFNESFIISAINYVVSLILTIAATIVVNSLVLKSFGVKITLLSFGIRQVLLMMLVSLLVAVVATFLPTHRISKMKPIDAIQERK